jgi:hypothetical protein
MNAPMHCSRSGRIAFAVLAALLGLAGAAEAQTLARASHTGDGGVAIGIGRAEALEAQARARLDQLNGSARTARLYERAAGLRAENDPVRVTDLHSAGRLYLHAGRAEAARHNLVGAAEAALRFGDIVSAAHSFVDAAWAAAKLGDAEAVALYARRAECLSHSPLITVTDATAIRARVSSSSRPVYVVR